MKQKTIREQSVDTSMHVEKRSKKKNTLHIISIKNGRKIHSKVILRKKNMLHRTREMRA